jgi:hypothetical protein
VPIESQAQWEGDSVPCRAGIGGAKENRIIGAVASYQAPGARGAGDGTDRSCARIQPQAQWGANRMPCRAGIGGAKENRTLQTTTYSQAPGARGAGDGTDRSTD